MISATQTATFFIDTVAPVVSLALGPNRIAGRPLRLRVTATDHPSPLPAAQTSGIASITVHWGTAVASRQSATAARTSTGARAATACA